MENGVDGCRWDAVVNRAMLSHRGVAGVAPIDGGIAFQGSVVREAMEEAR